MSRTTGNAPEIGTSSFDRINIDGTNAGARMFVRRGMSDKSEGCCCINIYTNSNVQGANGSVLIESNVKMKNPDVHLYFGDLKFGDRSSISGSSVGGPVGSALDFDSIILFAFVPVILTMLLSFMLS